MSFYTANKTFLNKKANDKTYYKENFTLSQIEHNHASHCMNSLYTKNGRILPVMLKNLFLLRVFSNTSVTVTEQKKYFQQ